MKINLLIKNPQSLKDKQNILYAPELKITSKNKVRIKDHYDVIEHNVYPAVRYDEVLPMKYFLIQPEEIGECEEYTRYPGKDVMYGYFNGKEGLEQKFQQMYNEQMKKISAAR